MKQLTKKVYRSNPSKTARRDVTFRSETPAIVIGEPGLVHCLGTEKIPVHTVSEDHANMSSWSRYSRRHYVLGQYDTDEFVDDLCRLGRSLSSKPVLMSHDDRALLTISENREKLSPHFRFLLPDKQMVEMLLDTPVPRDQQTGGAASGMGYDHAPLPDQARLSPLLVLSQLLLHRRHLSEGLRLQLLPGAGVALQADCQDPSGCCDPGLHYRYRRSDV